MKHYPTLFNNTNYFVVSEGVDIKRFEMISQSKQRQIVFPARSWPHKNHKVFFKSLQYLDEKKSPTFVLTGANTDDLIQYKPLKYKNVLVRGLISDDELTKLYSESFGVLSCSLYESSSLPILEGIASNCVAIASSIEAHVEMGKDLKIHFFDPENPKELANLIQILTQNFDERQISTTSNEIVILKFSWIEIWKAILNKVELSGNQR
jgi:glycosyltransferase involved in cell wall biosynthesis